MSETYMQRYIGKNIYKVSNPPGGHSSFKIGWEQPQTTLKTTNQRRNGNNIIDRNHNHKLSPNSQVRGYRNPNDNFDNQSFINNSQSHYFRQNNHKRQLNQQNSNRSFNQINDLSFRNFGDDNRSFMENSNVHMNSNKSQSNHPAYKKQYPSQHQNGQQVNFTYSPQKQTYKKYMDPNFIQPLNLNPTYSLSHLYQWQQSTRQMEQQLKYLQQKNKQLKEKVYGNFINEQSLNKYAPENIHSRRRVISLPDPAEQLQLALQQRYQNRGSYGS